jgi:hypothetical protein
VPEKLVRELMEEGLRLFRQEGHVDEDGEVFLPRKGILVWLRPRMIKRPDGRRFRLETAFYSGGGYEGTSSPHPQDPERSIRMSLDFPIKAPIDEQVQRRMRSTLSHELTHVLDPSSFRPKDKPSADPSEVFRERMDELSDLREKGRISKKEYRARAKKLIRERGASETRAYFNQPGEVRARRHELYRWLNTRSVAEKARRLSSRGVPGHRIVTDVLADNELWTFISQFLTPANRKQILTMAASTIQRRLEGDESELIRLAQRVASRYLRPVITL